MKKLYLPLVIAILLTALFFFLINVMGSSPGDTSGNGNPAIILMMLLVPLFCFFIYFSYKFFTQVTHQSKSLVYMVIAIVAHLLVGLVYQIYAFRNYKKLLQDVYYEEFLTVDYDYIDQITSFLSIHVNSQYFNINTFFMFLSLSMFIPVLIIFAQRLIKQMMSS
ncbi:hypothetical protein [Evansella cellulosilytica]|uniref:DUF4199 domain-containing protein n=1 Tax=Evansella cellulosilytica (strain ATCC 21833 / DSM 2522 / FERM P-1141 / JCM 9156 / N-4) TaxID=649639 RepID=E6U201_EVAC2|nr:hypothetical protein [Evansella cellulosilytica]ADU29245.1 hypothetical protein Bcell_0972 [Evansella cellulosilytica DSM 2522]